MTSRLKVLLELLLAINTINGGETLTLLLTVTTSQVVETSATVLRSPRPHDPSTYKNTVLTPGFTKKTVHDHCPWRIMFGKLNLDNKTCYQGEPIEILIDINDHVTVNVLEKAQG